MAEVGQVTVRVKPDTSKFRRELRSQLQGIRDEVNRDADRDSGSDNGSIRVRANIDYADFMRQWRNLRRLAAGLPPIRINTETDLGPGGGGGGRGRRGRNGSDGGGGPDLGGITSRLSKLKPSFGSGLNGPALAIILGGIMLVLAPLVGLLTAALLTIPGLIAAIVAPLGALVLGFEGLKKAAEVLKQPLTELKTTLSEKVQEQFTPVFKSLEKVFPVLKAGLPKVSKGVADMAQGFVDAVTSQEGMTKIENTLTNIGKALSMMKPGVESFTDGFLTLAEEFTAALPGFSEWFNGAGKSFMEWTKGMAESGELKTIFEGLGETLKGLSEGLGGVLKEGLEFMKDPEKVENFVQTLENVLRILERLVEISNKLQPVFDLLSGGEDGPTETDDWMGTKVDDLQRLADIFGTIGGMFETTWGRIQGILSQIGPMFSSAWNIATTAVRTGINNIVTTVSSFVGRFTAPIRAGLSQLPGMFSSAWSMVVTAVQTGVNNAVNAAMQLRDRIIAFFAGAGSWLVASGRALVQGFIDGITSMIGAAAGAAQSLVGAVRNLFPFSPAKEGPFSGSGYTDESGKALTRDFAAGIRSNTGLVSGATADVLSAARDQFLTDRGLKPDGWLLGEEPGDMRSKGIYGQRVPSTKDLEREEALLDYQIKELDLAIDQEKLAEKKAESEGAKEAAKHRADILGIRKDELEIQSKQLELIKAETEAARELNKTYGELFGKALGVPVDFAEAAGNQFFSDLGFSNDGLLPTLLTDGTKYVFNISNVDEAMAIKQREQNKKALQYNK
ncbi:tape measure protein [Gordonia phage Nebulosus]|nr:tape measure protein [Gordonia phage Nebulosus]